MAVSPSNVLWNCRAVLLVLFRPRAQLEPKSDEEHSEDERVRSNPDSDHHQPRSGRDDEEDAEDDGESAEEAEQPLVLDLLAQRDGGGELRHAVDHRPRRDQQHERERRQARPEERQHAADQTHQAFESERAPALSLARASKRRDEVEDAVDDGVRGEEQDKHRYGAGREDQGGDAEEDRGNTAHHQRPPVRGEDQSHGLVPFRGSAGADSLLADWSDGETDWASASRRHES